MNLSSRPVITKLNSDRVMIAIIFASTFLVFWLSPVRQITDSSYSMLLSQSLLKYRTFTLDHYSTAVAPVEAHPQLGVTDNHVYHQYPAGGPLLSVPFVAIANASGVSAVNADGTYSLRGEMKMQGLLAALLMAGLAVIFFLTARMILPPGWSVLIALSAAFGTQIMSTASRGLWSQTWQVLLLGIVILMLLGAETGRWKLRPIILASLLAWTYFARPTSSVPILAISVYIFLYHRREFWIYALTGIVWATGFATYSWIHFRRFLPPYYRSPLPFDNFGAAVTGNLISPSRGLLIYVPIVFFVVFLLVRYRKHLAHKRLVTLVPFVALAHLITISGLTTWWGGGCYGARMTTDLVPWLALSAILGVAAMLSWRGDNPKTSLWNWRLPIAAGIALLLISIFINARGAMFPEVETWENWRWNSRPFERNSKALWEWRYPQFLAGLIRPPRPENFPPAAPHIEFGQADSWRYLWYGWSGPESQFRWTDGKEAALVFALDEISELKVRMKCGAFLGNGQILRQRVNLQLNGHRLIPIAANSSDPQILSFVLPRDSLQTRNVLVLGLPDAAVPVALKTANDSRMLALSVAWIEFSK